MKIRLCSCTIKNKYMIAEMSDMSVSMTFKTKELVLQMQLKVSSGMMTVESTRLARGGCLRMRNIGGFG